MSDVVGTWLAGLTGQPDEADTKLLLRQCGMHTPSSTLLRPGDGVSVGELRPPFVVKVCSAETLHKTELGGVRLGVGRGDLEEVVGSMRERFPGKPLLIEEQIEVEGTEVIIGALSDPDFGPAVMVGAGGVLTEIFRDISFRLAPCSAHEALRMIDELQIAPMFHGFRASRLDADTLARTITTVADMAVTLGDRLGQLDINPVGFAGGQWVALDAKLVLKREAQNEVGHDSRE